MKIVIILCFIVGINVNVYSQEFIFDVNKYSFIDTASNHFLGEKQAFGYKEFLEKWLSIIKMGNSKLEILHIGDSHIQADFLTGQIRTCFQNILPGLESARGFIFPYNLAKTNNPTSYIVTSGNKWSAVWSTKQRQDSILGIAGIKICSKDSVFNFHIKQKDSCYYTGFKSIDIMFNSSDTLILKSCLLSKDYRLLPSEHICKLKLSNISKSIDLTLFANNELVSLDIFGFILRNNYPGVVYNSVGLNGAKAESINRCKLFKTELKYFNPDLIILSLGTNDLYSIDNVLNSFKINYEKVVQNIRSIFPHKPIILTSPGDFRVKHFYTNKQLNILPQVINNFAKKYNSLFWNFYLVMGGMHSMDVWWQNNLTASDKVHLNKEGYMLKGDLFFSAMLETVSKYNELKYTLTSKKND